MAGETVITVCGNLVDDPELRFTPSGAAVAKFRVASVPRVKNRETDQWEDAKDGLFLTCSVWRQPAEHVAESLTRGMRVIVQGQLKQRSYEKDGQKHTVFELDVHDVGPSLKSATAKVTKVKGGQGQGQQAYQQARQQQGAASVEDPWSQSTPGTQPAGGGWGQQGQGGGYDEAPPF
ncbi:single-stranded DNA-binding protein [Streptomyces sp. NPDC047737]|uniref:single-stranded DNA-binding protein n=1 Tax=Streptomyces sp. NPDC047737 TaxID=3155740 RepID=UPI0033C1F397